jgi:hypothetical protein
MVSQSPEDPYGNCRDGELQDGSHQTTEEDEISDWVASSCRRRRRVHSNAQPCLLWPRHYVRILLFPSWSFFEVLKLIVLVVFDAQKYIWMDPPAVVPDHPPDYLTAVISDVSALAIDYNTRTICRDWHELVLASSSHQRRYTICHPAEANVTGVSAPPAS